MIEVYKYDGSSDFLNKEEVLVSIENASIILVRGVPGSGKSTLAKQIKKEVELATYAYHFETDNYWIRPDGSYDWNPKKLADAHEWNLNQVREAFEYSHYDPIIVSNTFVKVSTIRPYLDVAYDFYKQFSRSNIFHAVIIECTGQFGNVHNVPTETVKRMEDTFETDYSSLKGFGEIVLKGSI